VLEPMLNQAPLFLLAVEVSLALGDVKAAHAAAEHLATIAGQARSEHLFAQADLAHGQITRTAGEPEAVHFFHSALNHLQQFEQSLLASRTKLELARSLQVQDPPAALTWARAALATFDRLGAAQDADEAARLLRELGVAGRVSPRQHAALTLRETEVLALLAHGLSNREIAERLVISAKTVEHHVTQVLGKLGLRGRAEAAAYATQHPNPGK